MTPHETACSSARGANRIRTGVYIVANDLQGKSRPTEQLKWHRTIPGTAQSTATQTSNAAAREAARAAAWDAARDALGPTVKQLREGRHPDERLLAPRTDPRKRPHHVTVHRRFKRCLELAAVEDFPMHELRHSAGDHLHRVTGDVKAAQELFRHASLKTTEDYLHPTSDDLRARMRQAEEE